MSLKCREFVLRSIQISLVAFDCTRESKHHPNTNFNVVVMEHRRRSTRLRIFMEEEEEFKRPNSSTISSKWFFSDSKASEDDKYVTLSHPFHGIQLRITQDSISHLQSISSLRFRITNKAEYEPFLEENEHRIGDIIQVYPREFKFPSHAGLNITLPSCVNSPHCGQLVCIYSANPSTKKDDVNLRWKPIDSECFQVNKERTSARILCRCSGLFCIKLTQYPEVTKLVDPEVPCSVVVRERKGVALDFPRDCVPHETRITLKMICLEDLYNVPSASPVSPIVRIIPTLQLNGGSRDGNTLDVTVSPVVLVRPLKCKFSKPLKLTLPLLGGGFDHFFQKENARLVALQSKVLDEVQIVWQHHYSTPEVSYSVNACKSASFLITRGGLYKLIRRIPTNHKFFIQQISSCVSREVCRAVSLDTFVSVELKGLLTKIAEPGKQFVLRIALFDTSQPNNPDDCLVSEVCSQPITLPLGKVRFLVRGRFEPNRDATDHREERTVVFTGGTTFVDFDLKLRLSDPTKIPDIMGKVTIHGEKNVQYYVTLHKPTPIGVDVEDGLYIHQEKRRTRHQRIKHHSPPSRKRQTTFTSLSLHLEDEPRKPTPVALIESAGQSDGSSRMTSVSDDTELPEDEMHCGSFPATETLQRNQSAHSVSTLQSTEYEDSWSADS